MKPLIITLSLLLLSSCNIMEGQHEFNDEVIESLEYIAKIIKTQNNEIMKLRSDVDNLKAIIRTQTRFSIQPANIYHIKTKQMEATCPKTKPKS